MPKQFTPTFVENGMQKTWYEATTKWQFAEAAIKLATNMVGGRTKAIQKDRALGLLAETIARATSHPMNGEQQ